MPEGPEVRRVTDILRSQLKGKTLLWISHTSGDRYSKELDRNKHVLETKFPAKCLEVLCRGKQIFFFFDNGYSIHSTLGLKGYWYLFSRKTADETKDMNTYLSEKNYSRFCLHFGDVIDCNLFTMKRSNMSVWYDDQINYGILDIWDWESSFKKMNMIGTDLLSYTCPFNDIEPAVKERLPIVFNDYQNIQGYFLVNYRNSRRQNMPVCKHLMNQTYYAGIGNYLKSEILYRARIYPGRLLSQLTDEEILRIFNVSVDTIKRSYIDPNFRKIVYKHDGEKDPNGYIIRTMTVEGGRTCYYVPELQK